MTGFLALSGLVIAFATLALILWSVIFPSKRLWPPKHYSSVTPFVVWIPTFTLAGIILALGILQWGEAAIPAFIRYGLGLPLIAAGNAAVWYEAAQFGIAQTGGAPGTLRTKGLYRYSRNPQYVADSAIILGWMLLSASPLASVTGSAAIIVLLAAPFAEESWLKEHYGQDYETYQSRVRRYL